MRWSSQSTLRTRDGIDGHARARVRRTRRSSARRMRPDTPATRRSFSTASKIWSKLTITPTSLSATSCSASMTTEIIERDATRDAKAGQRLKDILCEANLMGQERIGVDEGALGDARKTPARLHVGELGNMAFVLRIEVLEVPPLERGAS